MDALFVPLDLSGLRLKDAVPAQGPLARFDRLPWTDGAHQVNADRPWLGSALRTSPFSQQLGVLAAGVHLHWALPDALTRGADGQNFPGIPDRWMVHRRGEIPKTWIIESSAVRRSLNAPAGATLMPEYPEVGRPPWRQLGRISTLEEWTDGTPWPEHEVVTAMGYGDPLFAAYYPTCSSILGFHDTDPVQGDLEYDVLGWHGTSPDLLATTAPEDAADLAQKLGWDMAGPVPEHAMYYARLTLPGVATKAAPKPITGMAVAASAQQALARLSDAEPALMAQITHYSELSRLEADHAPTLDAADHRAQFVPDDGGARWALRAEGSDRPLPPSLAGRVTQLNDAQVKLDAARRALKSAREQLFADWSKYAQLVALPQADDTALDIDEVRAFVLQQIKDLRAAEAQIGQDDVPDAAEGARLTMQAAPSGDDLTAQVKSGISRIARKLTVFNQTGLSGQRAGNPTLSDAGVQFSGQDALTLDLIEGDAGPDPIRFDGLTVWLQLDASAPGVLLEIGEHAALELRPGNILAWITRAADGTTQEITASLPAGSLDLIAVANRDGLRSLWLQPAQGTLTNIATTEGAAGTIGTGVPGSVVVGAADGRGFTGTVSRITIMARALTEGELPPLLSRPRPGEVKLTAERAARFWKPRDPVIMLSGPGAAASGRHQRGLIACHPVQRDIKALWKSDRQARARLLQDLLGDLDAIALGAEAGDAGVFVSNGTPWHPMFLEWQAELHPFIAGEDIPPDHITSHFEVQRDGAEIVPQPGRLPLSPRRLRTHGRAILTPMAVIEHQKAAEQATLMTALPTIDTNAQSQALGGFVAALTQRSLGFTLPPDDPLALSDRRNFSRIAVRDAIRARTENSAPELATAQPDLPFIPLMAGHMRITRLRLVDAFGQFRDLDPETLAPLEGGTVPGQPAGIALPQRLAQPARVNFRWRAAKTGEETNDHPATSPICGWVVANYLDRGVVFHSADGLPLAELVPDDTPWRSVPGTARAVEPEAFPDPALGRLAQLLADEGVQGRGDILSVIHEALSTILPPVKASGAALGLIAGRPLAVVRARIGIELAAPAHIDDSWGSFARDLRRKTRTDRGISNVQLPLRLGDRQRIDDGLVGFWREEDGLPSGHFHAPRLTESPPHGVLAPTSEGFDLHLRPNESIDVLCLLDPMGRTHATSGILPVKSISIPDMFFDKALSRIATWSQVAPILSGAQPAMPLPSVPGRNWHFVSRTQTGWDEAPIATSDETATYVPRRLREGWIALKDEDPS